MKPGHQEKFIQQWVELHKEEETERMRETASPSRQRLGEKIKNAFRKSAAPPKEDSPEFLDPETWPQFPPFHGDSDLKDQNLVHLTKGKIWYQRLGDPSSPLVIW